MWGEIDLKMNTNWRERKAEVFFNRDKELDQLCKKLCPHLTLGGRTIAAIGAADVHTMGFGYESTALRRLAFR